MRSVRELPEEQLHEQSVEYIVRRANHSPMATQGGRRSYYGVGRRSQRKLKAVRKKGKKMSEATKAKIRAAMKK